jgi:hypothetical protein
VTAAVVPTTFNAALRRAKGGPDVKPLDADAARYPVSVLGVAMIDMYWLTADAARLHDAAVRLRGPGAVPYSVRVRRTPEWHLQADRLLGEVEQWSGKSEREERDYVYEKAVLYTGLLDLIPGGALHVRTLRSFVEFLRRTETDVNRRMLWFAFANRLLELSRNGYRSEVLSAMEESHQPTLVAYARLERMAPERKP